MVTDIIAVLPADALQHGKRECRPTHTEGSSVNKKISRLLGPGLPFYFFVLICFAVVSASFDLAIGAIEGVIIVVLAIYSRHSSRSRKSNILKYIESVTSNVDSATKDTMLNAPLPMIIFRPETGEIVWCNDGFQEISGRTEQLFDSRIGDVVPNFSARWLLECKQEAPELIEMRGREYRVYGNLTQQAADQGRDQGLLATMYWIDVTDSEEAVRKYKASRPNVAIIMMDNYDELTKGLTDVTRSAMRARIDRKINDWAAECHGLLRKYERDRYLFVFEEQYYEKLAGSKFSILDSVHEVVSADGVPTTLSIGVGRGAETFEELFHNATLSIDMALYRGGDQAVVRTDMNFEFFGGRAKETEKRTKVKSRVMATALGELMSDAGQVYVMGHKFADMDALGAAVGICCIARKKGKRAHIVMDIENSAAKPMASRLLEAPEYEDVFLTDPTDALLQMRSGALVVVVDTNRPDMVEAPKILERAGRVAVIDHHRRAATYIENTALNFHEPYASSASELVSELLQYLTDPSDVLEIEAEALLAGIVLDTKNFTVRTGGRTFDAAAYLRRAGADTGEVRRLFQNDLDSTINRYDVIRRAEKVHGNIALAAVDIPVGRVIAAQAADELLQISGIGASFVVTPLGTDVLLSARSVGDINVQVILEQLGGGGNANAAGGTVKDAKVSDVRAQLLAAIDEYFKP